MKHTLYSYRGKAIIRTGNWNNSDEKGWTIIDEYPGGEYKTLDEAKNAVDKWEGGWAGRCEPQRHFKAVV